MLKAAHVLMLLLLTSEKNKLIPPLIRAAAGCLIKTGLAEIGSYCCHLELSLFNSLHIHSALGPVIMQHVPRVIGFV